MYWAARTPEADGREKAEAAAKHPPELCKAMRMPWSADGEARESYGDQEPMYVGQEHDELEWNNDRHGDAPREGVGGGTGRKSEEERRR